MAREQGPPDARRPYFPPPDDYDSPSRCATCGEVIIFSAQVSGYPRGLWVHLPGGPTHTVDPGQPWWDVDTGTWKEGAAA